MTKNRRNVTKVVVRTVVGFSVGSVVSSAVKKTRDDDDSALDKAQTLVGGAVLGWMASEAASKYVERKLDDLFGELETAQKVVETPTEEN